MSKGYVTLPVGYKRVDNLPLESNTIFTSLELATSYASTDPTAYAGQIIAVVSDGVKLYTIQVDLTLKEVGSGSSQSQLGYDITSSPMTITHNLNRYPSVLVLDSENSECEGYVTYPSLNQVSVSWNGTLTGKVILL